MSEPFETTAERLLADAGDQRAQPAQLAARAVRIVDQLVQHLAPLIGDLGVRTLLARSAAVASVRFPWLAGSIAVQPEQPPLAALSAAVAQQEPNAARDGLVHLLATFVALLARLVGEALVGTFLHDLWPAVFPRAVKETP